MTIRAALTSLALLCAGWLSLVAAVTVFSDAAPALLVMFPDPDLLDRLDAGTAIVSASAFSVTLASEQDDFALSLYRNGALLVLPAGLKGCGQGATRL